MQWLIRIVEQRLYPTNRTARAGKERGSNLDP
jgi:hypothetical protein